MSVQSVPTFALWEKSVEAQDQLVVASEQQLHSLDHSRGINTKENIEFKAI